MKFADEERASSSRARRNSIARSFLKRGPRGKGELASKRDALIEALARDWKLSFEAVWDYLHDQERFYYVRALSLVKVLRECPMVRGPRPELRRSWSRPSRSGSSGHRTWEAEAGWVCAWTSISDWDEIAELSQDAYRRVAPSGSSTGSISRRQPSAPGSPLSSAHGPPRSLPGVHAVADDGSAVHPHASDPRG